MLKAIAAVAALFVAACATPIPAAEQAPTLGYAVPNRTLVAVIDDRVRTHEGRPENLLGFARSMGIPHHWTVQHIMVGNRADQDKTMAELLTARVVSGVNGDGETAQGVVLRAEASDEEARALLEREGAGQLLTLVMKDWHFDINLNWVGRFRFDSDAELIVQNAGGTVLRKRFTESQAIQAQGDESWPNMVIAAYRAKLGEILNDAEVRAALTAAPAAPMAAEAEAAAAETAGAEATEPAPAQ